MNASGIGRFPHAVVVALFFCTSATALAAQSAGPANKPLAVELTKDPVPARDHGHEDWRAAMARLPKPTQGCYKSTYPRIAWRGGRMRSHEANPLFAASGVFDADRRQRQRLLCAGPEPDHGRCRLVPHRDRSNRRKRGGRRRRPERQRRLFSADKFKPVHQRGLQRAVSGLAAGHILECHEQWNFPSILDAQSDDRLSQRMGHVSGLLL